MSIICFISITLHCSYDFFLFINFNVYFLSTDCSFFRRLGGERDRLREPGDGHDEAAGELRSVRDGQAVEHGSLASGVGMVLQSIGLLSSRVAWNGKHFQRFDFLR